MSRLQEIIATAQVFAGAVSDAERSVLERLCAGAEAGLRARLREGLTPEDCYDSFVCAAAWLALSGLQSTKSEVESFSAGNLTVKRAPGAANCLSMQAELMMAPYLKDGGFQFRRV